MGKKKNKNRSRRSRKVVSRRNGVRNVRQIGNKAGDENRQQKKDEDHSKSKYEACRKKRITGYRIDE